MTASSFYVSALRNARPKEFCRRVVAGTILAFLIPAAAVTAGLRIECNDEAGYSVNFGWLFQIAAGLIPAALMVLIWLGFASGPLDRPALLATSLIIIGVTGIVGETILSLQVSLWRYCGHYPVMDPSAILLYVHGAFALILPAVIVIIRLRLVAPGLRGDLGKQDHSTARAW